MTILILSIFHGPKVEPSFSAMGGAINKKANRMYGRTYSAIQTVKYFVRAQYPNSSSYRSIPPFKRQDKHYTLFSSILVNNMENARSLQKLIQCLKRKQFQDMNIEFEKKMSRNKKTIKQVVEKNKCEGNQSKFSIDT